MNWIRSRFGAKVALVALAFVFVVPLFRMSVPVHSEVLIPDFRYEDYEPQPEM